MHDIWAASISISQGAEGVHVSARTSHVTELDQQAAHLQWVIARPPKPGEPLTDWMCHALAALVENFDDHFCLEAQSLGAQRMQEVADDA